MAKGQYTLADLDQQPQQQGQYTAADLQQSAPAQPQPTATISAQPTGVRQTLQNFENDIRNGGETTLLGKMLHRMGAQGLNVGSQASAGDFMGSPVLGPTHMAQGAAQLPSSPWQGTKKIVGGGLETATIPASFIAPEASELTEGAKPVASAATGAVGRGLDTFKEMLGLPTKAHAGELFNQAQQAAGKVPIDLSAPGNTALQIKDMAESGGSMPKVVRDFLSRATNPDKGPLTYEEARQFYQNASRLSANEAGRLTPNQKRMVGQFASDLGNSIQQAATKSGVGEQYGAAMKEWGSAARRSDAIDEAKDFMTDQLKSKLPWLAYGYGAKKVYDATK